MRKPRRQGTPPIFLGSIVMRSSASSAWGAHPAVRNRPFAVPAEAGGADRPGARDTALYRSPFTRGLHVIYSPRMKKNIGIVVVLSLIAAFLHAQSPRTGLIYSLNLGTSKADIRLGEEKSPAYTQRGIQSLVPLPMNEIAPATQLKLYVKPSGSSAWQVIKGTSEGDFEQVRLHDIEAGHVYCVLINSSDQGVSAALKDCTAESNGPKIQLVNGAKSPIQIEVGTDKGNGEGLEPSGYTGPSDVSPFYSLKTRGTYGVFFGSFLWEEDKKFFYSAKEDPSRPAMIAFQDGAYYAAVARIGESQNTLFTFYTIPFAKGSAAAQGTAAAGASTTAAPQGKLTSVPASWNGRYAEESRPTRAALSVHDGKIWSVFGSSETETFPGPSRLYQFVYGETECRSVEKGNAKEFERYLFDPKTGKLIYSMAGQVPIVYVLMKGK